MRVAHKVTDHHLHHKYDKLPKNFGNKKTLHPEWVSVIFLEVVGRLIHDFGWHSRDTVENLWCEPMQGSKAKVTLEKLDSSKQGALFTYSIKVYVQALYRLRTPGKYMRWSMVNDSLWKNACWNPNLYLKTIKIWPRRNHIPPHQELHIWRQEVHF